MKIFEYVCASGHVTEELFKLSELPPPAAIGCPVCNFNTRLASPVEAYIVKMYANIGTNLESSNTNFNSK